MFSGDIRRMATVMTAEDNATGTMRRVQAQGDATSESLGQTASRAQMLGTAFKGAAIGTAALGAALGALVATQGQTEQTFARIAEVSGATADQMARVEDQAISIGKQLPISINQAASAMEQLAYAGFTVQEQLGAANQVANLAVSSQMNMQESARTTASLLNMYAIEAENAQQVTATLAATFSSSATNMQELSRGLTRAGQVATQVGISLSEVSAAMGVLADQGIRAARAGQAIRGALQRLIAPSAAAEEALAGIGFEMDNVMNAQGEFESLNALIDEFRTSLAGVESQAERTRIVTESVGRRGARALLPLINSQEELNEKMGDIFRSEVRESMGTIGQMADEEIEKINEATQFDLGRNISGEELSQQLIEMRKQGMSAKQMASQLQVALGISSEAAQALAEDASDASVSADQLAEAMGGATTASDIAASQMDTVSGSVKFLKSSLDTMAFAIFSGAGPAIQWFNEQLAAGINLLNNNETAMKAVGTALVALTGILAAVTIALGAQLVPAMISASLSGGILSGTFIATAVSAGTLTGAMYALAAGVWAALAPVLPFIAAGAALVAVLYMVYEAIQNNILGAGDAFNNLMTRMKSIWESLQPVINPIIEGFMILGELLLWIAAAPFVAQFIALLHILSTLATALDMVLGPIGEFFEQNKALADVLGFVVALVTTLAAAVAFAGPVLGALGTFVGAVATGFSVLATVIGGVISILGTVVSVVTTVASVIGTLIAVLNPVTLVILAVIGAIALFIAYMGGIGPAIDAVVGAVMGAVDILWNVVGIVADIGRAIVGAIVDGIMAYLGFVKDAFMMYFDFITTFWTETVPGAVSGVGGAIVNAIVGGLKSGVNMVVGPMKDIASTITDFLPFSNANRGPLSNIMSVGGNIIDALTGGLKAGVGAVADAAGAVAGAIGDAIGGAVDMAKGAGEAVASTVADGMKGAGGAVKDAASGVMSTVSGALPGSDADWGPLSNLTQAGPNLVGTLADGIMGNEGKMQDALGSVMGVMEKTPLGSAMTGAADSLGIELPGGGGGGQQPSGEGAAGGEGVTIQIDQSITVEGDGDAETLQQAAEQGTSQAVQDAIAELERLLQQDMNAGTGNGTGGGA